MCRPIKVSLLLLLALELRMERGGEHNEGKWLRCDQKDLFAVRIKADFYYNSFRQLKLWVYHLQTVTYLHNKTHASALAALALVLFGIPDLASPNK
jgi:hypothetical protein